MTDVYEELDERIRGTSGSSIGIRVGVSTTVEPGPSEAELERRRVGIRDFQATVLELWQKKRLPADFVSAPTWSAPVPDGPWQDADVARLLPLFVRTDESLDGLIYELQVPGSWWGSQQALHEVLLGEAGRPLAAGFAAELMRLFPAGVDVLHLFESSTSPHENVFFAHRVRAASPQFRYWGLDPEALSEGCGLVRAHSYGALVAEDLFRLRLPGFAEGALRFDLPPVALLDQKVPLALPFDQRTRGYFSDEHRQLFPYTALVQPDSVVLQTGEHTTLADLLRRPPKERAYLAKYAGLDATRNWGSRGVVKLRYLDEAAAHALLQVITTDNRHQEPWILQTEASSAAEMDIALPGGGTRRQQLTARASHFYGPTRHLGGLLLGSPGKTVHWTDSIVLALLS